MTKILIDRSTVEQALEALEEFCEYQTMLRPIEKRESLRAALAEPVQEPFGYFRAEPFGWTDCAATDEGAIPLYTAPPQRKPLTEEEIGEATKNIRGIHCNIVDEIARAIERAHGIGGKA